MVAPFQHILDLRATLLLGINGQTLKNGGLDSVRTSDSEVQSYQ